MTFSQCVDAYLDAHNESWSNPKHRQQWRNTLTSYAGPVIGGLDVAQIEVGHVLKVCSRSGRRRQRRQPAAGPH
jgi:hypothetical protein